MTKPTNKHVYAIQQSIRLLENALRSAQDPKFIRALQRDIMLHQQVCSMLWKMIENPTLPFLDEREGHAKTNIGKFFQALGPKLDTVVEDMGAGVTPSPPVSVPLLNQIEDEPDEAD